jgi:hypothetical protein
MAISSVVTFHVRYGRQGEQVENLKAVKRLVERGLVPSGSIVNYSEAR